ncbi:hypothetical protein MTO96_016639 [Rhipicephalus appendiculatus]
MLVKYRAYLSRSSANAICAFGWCLPLPSATSAPSVCPTGLTRTAAAWQTDCCRSARRAAKLAPIVARGQPAAAYHGRALIGKREVVGFGMNGEYSYIDNPDFPMPAIRYKEPTPDIEKLREKEKGGLEKPQPGGEESLVPVQLFPDLC